MAVSTADSTADSREIRERLGDCLGEILDEMRELRHRVGRLSVRLGEETGRPAPERKYNYTEAGVRLTTGRDPLFVPEEKWKKCLSRKSVQRLVNDGDCVLRAVTLGGSRYITEASIRQLEKGIENGEVAGYQVKRPREYRK